MQAIPVAGSLFWQRGFPGYQRVCWWVEVAGTSGRDGGRVCSGLGSRQVQSDGLAAFWVGVFVRVWDPELQACARANLALCRLTAAASGNAQMGGFDSPSPSSPPPSAICMKAMSST